MRLQCSEACSWHNKFGLSLHTMLFHRALRPSHAQCVWWVVLSGQYSYSPNTSVNTHQTHTCYPIQSSNTTLSVVPGIMASQLGIVLLKPDLHQRSTLMRVYALGQTYTQRNSWNHDYPVLHCIYVHKPFVEPNVMSCFHQHKHSMSSISVTTASVNTWPVLVWKYTQRLGSGRLTFDLQEPVK